MERYFFERPHGAAAGAEFDRQINDGEQRRGFAHVRLRGSIRSRKPSPSRLKQKTASISARPGNSATHHSPEMMLLAPSATMMPHSAVGGLMPRPIKERPAALRFA